MKKTYTDELGDWVRQRAASRPRQDRNLVAFLAVRTDVASAVKAGYKLKTIWAHLHETGRIPYRYETFLRHVRRHLGGNTAPAAVVRPLPVRDSVRPGGLEPPGAGPGAFTFNASPRQEDLI